MSRVAIVGGAMTSFGHHWESGLGELAAEAGILALEDAGISSADVEAIYGGTMSSGLFAGQEHLASLIADQVGLTPRPSVRVEAACASGALALRMGMQAIKSGMHDIVVVGGVEKMTDQPSELISQTLATASSQEWEVAQGATFPALYAMLARLHMHSFGTTEEQLAAVAVKNHRNALSNPCAQFRKEVTIDEVLRSSPVADPLKLLDCSPASDGAAAVVLCSEEKAASITDTPVWILGSGHATDTLSLHDRADLLSLRATAEAARQAYAQSGIGPDSLGMAEVHDCFTIAEILAIEDLGFAAKGTGGPFTEAGHTKVGGRIPVNPSGGLKAKGHPVGASGVAQAVEAMLQLRGEASGRNTNARTALIHSVGGSGGTAVVHILGLSGEGTS